MPEANVTVAIPTYNRSQLLNSALESVLTQDYPDFRIVVLDNASTDDTEAVVRSFADSRLTYVRNETNIGLFRNWNRAIEVNVSPYLVIFGDDDVMLSGFLRESVQALEKHPRAALSFTFARTIDVDGNPLRLLDVAKVPEQGVLGGLEFLHRIAAGEICVIRCSTVMMRSSALAQAGPFDNTHSNHTIDLNLFYRLAAKFDFACIPKELARIRHHAGRESERQLNSPGGTGKLSWVAERTDAIAYLMQSVRAEDSSYRRWLAERLLYTSKSRSELTSELVPSLNLLHAERLEIVKQELAGLISAGDSFLLVDGNKWGSEVAPGRLAMPFLERDGLYWGPPPDDKTAIRELQRMRKSGLGFIVFGWPAFWWLDYYSGLRDYLESTFRCVVSNSRLVVFDLRA